MHKVHIYFAISDWDIIHKIQERFNLPKGVTVNGETYEEIKVE